jgi:hypothetical protein
MYGGIAKRTDTFQTFIKLDIGREGNEEEKGEDERGAGTTDQVDN